MKNFFLAVISVFFLFSCSNTTTLQNNSTTGTAVKQKDIADTSWKLTAISGEKITTKMMDGKEIGAITLDITTDKISGSSGVNRYFGSYTLNGKDITLSGIGSTRMMGPQDLMENEHKYLSVLSNVTGFEFKDNNTLVLKAGTDTLTFVRVK
ncbi:META domain-containing protein [Sebaldella sp. S0638]|uniref:META domain-containing protein n=1 Tax=Sebaldella sp. S0638 TaxID=2957809 RepID=UPI0020A21578|nr:META domain-containing protein [Sebaldella sp. S0638]MCP1223988.1 META domain-containing protein [Sebaldella sp. S0638]